MKRLSHLQILILMVPVLAWAGGGIDMTPVPITVPAGEHALFKAHANSYNNQAVYYQWIRNGADIAGATTATLDFVAQASDNGATFSCRIRYYYANLHVPEGWVTETVGPVALTVVAAGAFPPAITAPASGTTLNADQSYTFSANGLGLRWTAAYDNGATAPDLTSQNDLQRATFTIPITIPVPHSVTVTIKDRNAAVATATYPIFVPPTAPNAGNPLSYGSGATKIYPGMVLTVPAPGYLTGATDVNGGVLTGSVTQGLVSDDAYPVSPLGTLVTSPDGSFTYTAPTADYYGLGGVGTSMHFQFRVVDSGGLLSQPAFCTILLSPNANSRINPDTFIIAAGAPATLNVRANDVDPDKADLITITAIPTAPTRGTATIVSNAILYTPSAGFTSGTDTFTYTAGDGKGPSATATVTVGILGSGGAGKPGDLNGDGVVDALDLQIVTGKWGTVYP